MKKTLSILLAVVMLLGVLPLVASADAGRQISSVVITDLDEPIIGEHPDFDVTIENAKRDGLKCQVIWIQVFTDEKKQRYLSSEDQFEKGKKYYCGLLITSDVGNFIGTPITDGNFEMNEYTGKVTINGKAYKEKITFFQTNVINLLFWSAEAKKGTHYTVTFEKNGYGDTIEPVSVLSGKTVNKPKFQFVRGMEFCGWYSDPELETEYDFTTPVTKNLTLYAKWSKAKPVSSDETEPVTEPEPVVPDYVCPFVDVPENEWYFPWVSGAHKMGLINGKDDTHYKPDDNMTYAEAIKLAACMNQLNCNGEITLANGEEHWYDTYVAYCLENGIISEDYSAVINESIDRQTYAAIFSKALPAEALEAKNDIPDGSIPDVQNDNPYYDAIYTLYRAGVINGSNSYGAFNPTNFIRRSEVAAILNRMMDASVRVGAPAELLR